MKIFKKLCAIGTLSVVLATSLPTTTYFGENISTVEAATQTIKLNKTKLSLTVGEKATLKLSGTKSKITWSTSDKTIATVSEGKVTAKKAGKTTITATVNKKKYTCEVTIKKAVELQEIKIDNISFKIPKSYKELDLGDETEMIRYFTAPGKGISDSAIMFYCIKTGLKADYVNGLGEETLQDIINESLSQVSLLVLDVPETDSYDSKAGNVLISEYSNKIGDVNFNTVLYLLVIDNYIIEIMTYGKDDVKKEFSNVSKNICDTLQVRSDTKNSKSTK